MKAILIRTLAIAIFATSISGFAGTDKAKPVDTATDCATTQPNEPTAKAPDSNSQHVSQPKEKNQEEENKILQENKAWNDSLAGIFG